MKRVEPHLRRPASWPHRNDSKIVSDLPGCCCDQCVIRKATSRKKRIFIACVCDLRTRNKKSTKNIVIMVSWCTIVSRTVHRFIWIVINEWIVPIRCVWDHWMIKLYVCSEIFSLIFLFSLSLYWLTQSLIIWTVDLLCGWDFQSKMSGLRTGEFFLISHKKNVRFEIRFLLFKTFFQQAQLEGQSSIFWAVLDATKKFFIFFFSKNTKNNKIQKKKKRKKLIEQKLFFSFNAMRH